MHHKIPELLAPVGGWPQLKAAVQNGADAVYMGGPLFNARIKADNFSHEDMKAAIDYAHARNVKVYITLNTLIKDRELFQAFSYINELYAAGADAVILQDLGIARLVRKYLPEMPMHLSTQGTIYNKWAAETIKELGFCRVVPARELSLQEIREFTAECHDGTAPCEVEVFIHGALCMCYSGQCQMSRVLGGINGRSGNRGLCAQPCRLPYEDEQGRKSFLLSPKDICTLSELPHLCEAGVDSLKIEGRLKSPQYVAIVTSIYRKYLNQYRADGAVTIHENDMQRLTQIFNRGGFSAGYLHGNPGAALLSGDSPKNQGIYVGNVKSVKKGSSLVDIQLAPADKSAIDSTPVERGGNVSGETRLAMGDGVEIRGKFVAGNIITYLKELSPSVLRIGDIKERVAVGDKVYKVTDKKLLAAAEKSFADDYARKVPVEMKFTALLGAVPTLCIKEIDQTDGGAERSRGDAGHWIRIDGEKITEKAINKPLVVERVKAQLGKLGDTVFRAVNIEVELDEAVSLPVSVLNRLRREAVEQLLARKCRVHRQGLTDDILAKIKRDEIDFVGIDDAETCGDNAVGYKNKRRLLHVYSKEDLEMLACSGAFAELESALLCIPIELYMEKSVSGLLKDLRKRSGCRIIPYVLNVSKGSLDQYMDENFSSICETVKETGLLAGNLGWIKRFQDAGVKVYGDYGLNVYNRQSEKALEEIGVEVLSYSHEMQTSRVEEIPLMITEHPVSAKFFRDRKGEPYEVTRSASGDKYLIFKKSCD